MARVIQTIYSEASDGEIYKYGAVYADVQEAVEGIVIDDDIYMFVEQLYVSFLARYYIDRSAVFFDTSIIPAGCDITKVVLSLYVSTDASEVDFDVVVMNGMPTYPHEPMEVGDYNIANYSGNGGSKNSSEAVESQYFDIELNETGRSWIPKGAGAKTKFALISSRDINKTAPQAGILEELEFITSKGLYAYQKPKLTIYYNSPDWEYIGNGVFNYSGNAVYRYTVLWSKVTKAKEDWTKVDRIDMGWLVNGWLIDGWLLDLWGRIGKPIDNWNKISKDTGDFTKVNKEKGNWTKVNKE